MRIILIICALLLPSLCCADDAQRIKEIKTLFAEWQPILKNQAKESIAVYCYASGDNYEKSEWSLKELKTEGKVLSDKYTVLQKRLGDYVLHEQYSFSGDWFVISEQYYDKKGRLFFVFWKMNTFQADEPATIEKRLYFSENGEIIKNLKDVYKMNTKQKQKVDFMDHEVEYETEFKSSAIYEHLPRPTIMDTGTEK